MDVRTGDVQAILNNYESLQKTMDAASYRTDDCSRRAGGNLAMMDKFSIYFGLKLSRFLFSIYRTACLQLSKAKLSMWMTALRLSLCALEL